MSLGTNGLEIRELMPQGTNVLGNQCPRTRLITTQQDNRQADNEKKRKSENEKIPTAEQDNRQSENEKINSQAQTQFSQHNEYHDSCENGDEKHHNYLYNGEVCKKELQKIMKIMTLV